MLNILRRSTLCLSRAMSYIVNQLEGNNVVTTGYQEDGALKSPGYNWKMGFNDGSFNFFNSTSFPCSK
jgi:hypothetical protein